MADDIITRDGDGNLAVNVVTATEADVPYNYDDCFTLDTDGRRALRVVGAGGGMSGDFVPQLEELPLASAENEGMLVQYSGETVEEADATAVATQTVGTGLSGLSVNVNTFVEAEQPSGSETVNFVAGGTPNSAYVEEQVDPDGWTYTFDGIQFAEKFYEVYGVTTDAIVEGTNPCAVYRDGNNWSIATMGNVRFINISEWGITVSGTVPEFGMLRIRGIAGGLTWSKNGTTVDLASYGISYSGTPDDEDVISVVYTPAVKGIYNGYFYQVVETEHTDSSISISQYVGLGVVPSVNQQTFESQISESGTYDFSYNGSGWSLDGSAVTLADYGITYTEEKQAEVQEIGGSITDVSLDAETFVNQVPSTGEYQFSYSSGSWLLNGNAVDLADYGISATFPEGEFFVSQNGWAGKPNSLGDIEVDKTTFKPASSGFGVYEFFYTELGWSMTYTDLGGDPVIDGDLVDLEDFGISYDGVGNQEAYVEYQVNSGNYDLSIDENTFLNSLSASTQDYMEAIFFYDGSNWYCELVSMTTPVNLADYGITIDSGTYQNGDEFNVIYVPEYNVPEIGDSITVEYLSDGGAEDGDSITVNCEKGLESGEVLRVEYTAESTTHDWVQKEVQPAGGSGGIDWAGQWDKPADVQYWTYYPHYIFDALPEGNYEFYVQSKKNVGYGQGIADWSYKTFRITFRVAKYSGRMRGRGVVSWVLDGETDFKEGNITGLVRFQHQTDSAGQQDLIRPLDSLAWGEIRYNAVNRGVVDALFRWSNIKNLDTGEETPVTIDVKDYQTGLTYSVGEYEAGQAVQLPDIMYREVLNYPFGETQQRVDLNNLTVAKNQDNGGSFKECEIELKTSHGYYLAKLINKMDSCLLRVYDKSGDLENVQVGELGNSGHVSIMLNTSPESSGMFTCAVSVWGLGNGYTSIGTAGTYEPADEFVGYPEVYVGGDVTPESIGMILQYDGATDANYTNGYFYKASGTVVVTPESITFSNYTEPDFTVSVPDVGDFVDEVVNNTGWSASYIREMLASEYAWDVTYNIDSGKIDSINFGFWSTSASSILNTVNVNYTGSSSGQVAFTANTAYSPESKEVQNPSWNRVDVQPSGGGGSYLPLTGGTLTGDVSLDGQTAILFDGGDKGYIRPSNLAYQTEVGYKDGSSYTNIFSLDFGSGAILPSENASYHKLGSSTLKWGSVYVTKINNGNDIDVPTTGGTMVVATPPTTPNTTWVLKATVDANGDYTVAWVQEV